MNREQKIDELLELLNIPEVETMVFLHFNGIKRECAEQIQCYRELKQGFKETAHGDWRLFINRDVKKIKTYNFELHRREEDQWVPVGLDPQPPEGTDIGEIMPPELIRRIGFADVQPETMQFFKKYCKTPSGSRLFQVQFIRQSDEHTLGTLRIGKAPLLAEGPKRDEPPQAGTEENLKVLNCDWNYEEHTDEEHLKQLFYDMQKHPEIKKYILEVYFTQVRPWKNRSIKMTT